MRRALLFVVAAAAVFLVPRAAAACAACGCGDPTLPAMGTEKPFRHRLRASVDARYRTDAIGEPGVDRVGLAEARVDAQVAWAPSDSLFLLASVPALHRTVDYVSGAETRAAGMGDVELRAKGFVFADRSFSPRHLFALVGGLKLPTAPRERAEDGRELPTEVQPGTGSWDPILGMSYAFFARPWSAYASVQAMAPLRGTSGFRASSSLRTTWVVQRQLIPELALRLGVDARLDGRSYEDGEPERDSSGFVAFASTDLLVSPLTDLVFVLSAKVPVVQALAGFHREGPVWGVGTAYDF